MKIVRLVLIITLAVAAGACKPEDTASESDSRLLVAQDMVQAWNDQDWERVYELFAEDGVLHSVMKEPVVGRESIRSLLTPISMGIEQIELQIRNSGIVDDVVVLERVDDFVYNGKHSRVPVVGILEIADGKVQIWREYYDHKSLADALTPNPRPEAEILAEAEVEIRAIIDQLQIDWNGGDMDAYLGAYWNSDEFSLMFGSTGIRGWQAVHDLFNGNWKTEEAMGDFVIQDLEIRFSGPDMAIASGRFEHQFPDEKIIGGFTHVLRRFDGEGWRIIHEHTSRGEAP